MNLKNIDLLIQIHLLMAKDEDESIEAENIRDEAADEWLKLTQDERQWLDNLSAKLYDLVDAAKKS